MPDVEFDAEAVDELRVAWLQRCSATGCLTGPDDTAERYALLVALERAAAPEALARVRGTFAGRERSQRLVRPAGTVGARRRALDDAAAAWGASVASPALVVEQMLLLRHLVSGSAGGERIGRLVDRAMLAATGAATDELQRAAFSDPLTGCANRRALERDLERELARCARAELDLCVVAIDVDGLKEVNDSEGHAAGDRLLLQLVETLRRALRGLDGVYRIGGDEFVVVLADAGPAEAAVVMARVSEYGAPAFSWGAASVRALGRFDAALLLHEADDQLYERRRSRRSFSSRPSPPRRHQVASPLAAPQAGAIG
ncbi:MAG TPA: GGDEF domain-containing protein [Acidimicrobiales bacterium]|nr:GGDEF domain-containing protein [Acidimicrobiales bacterium]